MADDSKKGLGRGLTLAIGAAVVVAGAAALYVIGGAAFKPASSTGEEPAPQDPLSKWTEAKKQEAAAAQPSWTDGLKTGSMAKLQASPPTPPPATAFVDAAGKPVTIADLKGQVLVVNLWATWCGPCKQEMPTLAALQKAYEGKPVKVVAVSIDGAAESAKAREFIRANAPLAFYQDAELQLPFKFAPPALGYPTTILFDRSGVERGRMVGDADWASPEAKAVIERLLAS